MIEMRGLAARLASPISDTMIATTLPCSAPNTSTPRQAITARRNSMVRTLRMTANSSGWISPPEQMMTTVASAPPSANSGVGAGNCKWIRQSILDRFTSGQAFALVSRRLESSCCRCPKSRRQRHGDPAWA
jgi:hypothetical protein